jgi:UbiD family decarboxylase
MSLVGQNAKNSHWAYLVRFTPVSDRIADILLDSAASLDKLPIVTWTPGKDKAPYITTIVITRNHDTGVQNMGVYRTMVRDTRSVVVNLSPGRQGTFNARTWTDRREGTDCLGDRQWTSGSSGHCR